MVIYLSPIVPWSAPPQEKLLYGLLIAAVLLLFDRARSKPAKSSVKGTIEFMVLIAILFGISIYFSFFAHTN
jgi:hypothetical protein